MTRINYCHLALSFFIAACNTTPESIEIGSKIGNDSTKIIDNKAEVLTSIDSSDCSNWIVIETDKYSKKNSSYGKEIKLPLGYDPTGYLEIVTYAQDLPNNKKVIGLMCNLNAKKNCIDKSLQVDFLFEDSTSFTLMARSEFNCKGEFIILFDDNFVYFPAKKRLQDFLTKSVVSCRINGYDQITEIKWNAKSANQFKHTLICVQNM